MDEMETVVAAVIGGLIGAVVGIAFVMWLI